MRAEAIRQEFETIGRCWFRGSLDEPVLAMLDATARLDGKVGERLGFSARLRDCLSGNDAVGGLMKVFGDDLVPVRIVAFNKSVEMNWAVSWHQDRVIAVAARHEVSGFGKWSLKGGIWHCEPPSDILERMFFVRVHLDDNTPDDGTMRIALGSHRFGTVPEADAQRVAEGLPLEDCSAARGDVLVLKMLTLHASAPSVTTKPRRVLRIDYAPRGLLPPPLAWL